MSTPKRRGAEPLPEARELAPLLREVAGLVLALEAHDPCLDDLVTALREAAKSLQDRVPVNLSPRVGAGATGDGRVYLDHSRDIGSYNPCFPEYEISVDEDKADGTVTFPLAFEGPPGMVHGGFLSLFADIVVQHHNCELGAAGKTTFVLTDFLRPAPLATPLTFTVTRTVSARRSSSDLVLSDPSGPLCSARVGAIVGDPSKLPPASARRDVS
jgi:hypothetical protein